ncbi:hypothetical protein [Engelhardtia mirabilis]|uniref:Uncharacterized protein n=1 Tax=Engelhardtia mirabilis TaxID=2528011 RepID=A0A518BPL0_9BACT|nr:hypothetical protein Pla133_40240 [Planctomycetes bacterium Pla133]QDV03236.1 hypothetical protein Pla86_40230 [Planctomycetes bacterium Pla86]
MRGGSVAQARTLVRGLALVRGKNGLSIVDEGEGLDFAVDVDDVVFDSVGNVGLVAVVDQGAFLSLDLRGLSTRLVGRAARLRATQGTIAASARACDLSGIHTGLELRALGSPGASAIGLDLSGVELLGAATNGLRCEVTDGNLIATVIKDCLLAGNGPCLGPTPLPTSGAILDLGPAVGQIFHDIERTIFYANGTGCTGNLDLSSYRPNDYLLDSNLYGFDGLPGGLVTADPGFVDPSLSTLAPHLLPGSVAIDLSSAAASTYVWGDIDCDFPIQDGASAFFEPGLDGGAACFPGTVDAGLDERRPHSLHVQPALRLGQTPKLRALGPPQAAPIRAWFLFGAPPGAPSQCPAGPELPPGFVVLGAVDLAPSTGLAELVVAVPDDPDLLGVEVGLQALFVDPSNLTVHWSRALRERIVRP